MQKAMIVRYRYREERRSIALKELNDELADGWRVIQTVPMEGVELQHRAQHGASVVFAALVILAKPGSPPEAKAV